MVKVMQLRKFVRDEDGATLIEAILTLPIMVFIMAAIVEFGVLQMSWIQLTKAAQVGARLATVSEPLTEISSLSTFNASDFPNRIGGDAMPANGASVSCGAGTGTACDMDELARLYFGGDNTCGNTSNGLRGICDIAPFLPPERIRVTYSNGGLGYVGRPFGPVVVVTVEFVDVPFNFLIFSRLLNSHTQTRVFTFPSFPVTFVSEDLSNCEGC